AVLPGLGALPRTREARARFFSAPEKTSNSPAEAARSTVGAILPDFNGGWLTSPSSSGAPSFDSATIASVGGIAIVLALAAMLSPRREKWLLALLALATLAVAVGA